MNTHHRYLFLLAATVASAMSGTVYAQEAGTPLSATQSLSVASAAPGTDAAVNPFADAALGDGVLGAIAGREDTTQISHAEQVAGVSRNTIGDNSTTGDAKISDNAFQNLSGLSILNVNTGNNVAINAAMNVNISISPSP